MFSRGGSCLESKADGLSKVEGWFDFGRRVRECWSCSVLVEYCELLLVPTSAIIIVDLRSETLLSIKN
jgi:hypothetical protein